MDWTLWVAGATMLICVALVAASTRSQSEFQRSMLQHGLHLNTRIAQLEIGNQQLCRRVQYLEQQTGIHGPGSDAGEGEVIPASMPMRPADCHRPATFDSDLQRYARDHGVTLGEDQGDDDPTGLPIVPPAIMGRGVVPEHTRGKAD